MTSAVRDRDGDRASYASLDDAERSFALDMKPSLGRTLAAGLFGKLDEEEPYATLPRDGNLCSRITEGARNFLNGQSFAGKIFDVAIISLIVLNVCCMIVYPDERGTILAGYRNGTDTSWGTAAWGTESQRKQAFDTIETISVIIFTIEWLARFMSATEDRGPRKAACCGKTMCIVPPVVRSQVVARVRYTLSLFSLIDLATIVPYYVDLALTSVDLPSVQFIRVARLLRVFREGSWIMGSTATAVRQKLFDQIWNTRAVWYASLFLGLVIWIVCSSLYYVAERNNDDMIWETYGDCKKKGTCVNRMDSIPSAMYFCLVNLFGEYPLADNHSPWGKVICSFVAVVAAIAVGIPAGLLGNGFQDAADAVEEEESGGDDDDVDGGDVEESDVESGKPQKIDDELLNAGDDDQSSKSAPPITVVPTF